MRHGRFLRYGFLVLLVVALAAPGRAGAQSLADPLSFNGAHQRSTQSAAVIGAGGMTMLARDDASTMLHNPAMLATLSGIQVSLGGIYRSVDRSQVQQYAPVRYYPNLSLLLEGLADQIPDPDPELVGFTPADSVQRDFDDISPNWSSTGSESAPLQAFVAAPVTVGGFRLAAGFGIVEYGDFGYYYQNNNAVSPNILSQRPLPMSRPTDDNPVDVDWYQAIRSREGAITGYGGALAMNWERYNVALGVSGTYLTGSTDDLEQDVDRGQLRFFANYFRATAPEGELTRRGTSDFSGFDLAISTTAASQYVTAGLTVRAPMTITRRYTLQETSDAGASTVSGEDELRMPWRGAAGLVVNPRDNLRIGLEYELRPYGSVRVTDAEGTDYPWMSSSAFRIGADYALLPWLSVRGGMRREAEPYGAAGSALVDDPVWATTYSVGAGASVAGVRLNVAYENRTTEYEDIFASAIHRNQQLRRMIVADLTYTLDWARW